MISVIQRLQRLGFELPNAPAPVGNYQAYLLSSKQLFISGQLPIVNGVPRYQGRLGQELSLHEGYQAAQLSALNILSQVNQAIGFDSLKTIIKVEGFINATDDFNQHAKVLDGASDLFSKVLQHKAGHIRSVIGCSSLPLNVAVEISVIAECI